MRHTLQIFAIAAALAFCGVNSSAQQQARDKVKMPDPQIDTARVKTLRPGGKHDSTKAYMAPDNTGRNKRDTMKTNLTPMDQGGSTGDVETTRKIRAGIMKLDGLSVNAQNIKIITVNGRVTLRGPVNSKDEKHRIANVAEKIASSGKIDNQLEVTEKTQK